MKTIGLIGGMSWESTVPYYRLINEAVRERLGGLHSAKIILYSVDFHEIEQFMQREEWENVSVALAKAAALLESAGADVLVLCTNTMHKVAGAIEAAVSIPFLHIIDPAADAIKQAGLKTVGLLGTRFTMEQPFYRDRLQERHGLRVLIPDTEERAMVHRVIFDELCLGKVVEASRRDYAKVIERQAAQGAEAVILGCTEISLLIERQDCSVPLFDTTSLHARRAAEWALSGP